MPIDNYILHLALSVICGFLFGFIFGYLAGIKKVGITLKLPQMTITTYFAIMVSTVWIISKILLFFHLTTVDASIDYIFGAIVSAMFGEGVVKNIKNTK